ISKDADISLLYIKGKKDENSVFPMVAKLGDDKRVEELQFNPETDEECNVFANSLMIKKDFMMSLVAKCASTNRVDLVREMLNMDLEKIKVVGFEQEGFLRNICSMQDYYDVSMELMDEDVRDELFYQQRPIYTKIRDDIPSRYGFESSVSSSLIAQGCTVEGKVKNSILSKSVAIGKNAQIENCIIMQDTVIGEGSKLSNVIIDKDCVISENTQMIGAKNYPVFISKGSVL
ncbi:MAG: glucose-1-phosphate adenylyltransferase subunit GlgD, partial [Acutalibacteraceae bacterium]